MLWIQFLIPLFLIDPCNTLQFATNMTFARIPEDTPVGSTVFYIVTKDPEINLKYGIEGPHSYYFNVDSMTGRVELAISLDYESRMQHDIILSVEDSSNIPVRSPMTIIVEDCNDNAPVFLQIPYSVNVFENTTSGSIIFTVSAVDYDNGGLISPTYEIVSVIPSNENSNYLFIIQGNGDIVLNGTLNYNTLSSFYQLLVKATDSGGKLHGEFIYQNSTTYVSLNIVDVPDIDPQFLNAPYTISVLENTELNTEVLRVSAVDGDKQINDNILYFISNASYPNLFNLSVSGYMCVSGLINREDLEEEGDQVQLEVMAQEEHLNVKGEHATSFTTVTIRVLDVNDNKPQFYNCDIDDCNFKNVAPSTSFMGEIEEHSAAQVPVSNLTITANDPDKDQNGVFYLTLRGTYAHLYSVSPSRIRNTGQVQVLVSDSVGLDYEKIKSTEVEIVANDTGNLLDCCSIAKVSIVIIDINDHIPKFDHSTYQLEVYENCADGLSIGRITATDEDSGAFGTITYQLLPESILENFRVDTSSGEISVVNGSLLDRERRSVYYATLQAQDGGNATSSTLLEITILDENDEIPTAIGTYNIFVNENVDDISIQIEAVDNDEPNTNNSFIEFHLLPSEYSGNFTVDLTTGLITSLTPLDREAINVTQNGRVVLTVELKDRGKEPLSSEVNITINVEDLNDNEPLFRDSQYNFSVHESTKGAFVGSLQASDHDQTELNNRVSFRISQGGSGNFIIRAQKEELGLYRGDLFVDPEVELDYERQKSYDLIIEAQDNGLNGVSHTASANVSVHVLDLNDEPPQVDPSSLKDVYLSENGTGTPELLTILTATDPDTDHELEFQELSVECFKNGADVGSICYSWLWLAENGSLYSNDTGNVDYELCDLVTMLFRVEDKNTLIGNRFSNNATVRVVIEDINDNAPEFLAIDETFVVVPDVAPFDYQVALVKATDNDTGVNAEIQFSITSLVFFDSTGGSTSLSNIFSNVTSRENDYFLGSIRVATSLDAALKGQYQVTVTATDQGIPSLQTTHLLNIFTVDVSFRVSLTFSKTPEEVRAESSEIIKWLTVATKATVYISEIKEASSTKISSRAATDTIIYLYFVYSNGTAITPQELDAIIRSDTSSLNQLLQLGLKVIGGSGVTNADKKDEIFYGVIAGLAGAILLIVVIFITALCCMRKSHNRKLRAIKASKIAKTLPGEVVQGAEVIPGTNMFNSERSNPMLNVDLGPIIDLGFDENSSISDSISVDSLYHHIQNQGDPSMPQESQEAAIAPAVSNDTLDGNEPLALAITDRINKAYDNVALDTTDL
ncbi:cadherin-related family member 2 [Pelobates cultripes]|uniref:Cadherin-related family member 2 n=1 Tax=Pelobates cultripes TaxID=61616 RepID=A0AAD1RRV9_PELCU|nr:cadherin-related family member 2 [Pelobates cultripes]